MTMFQVIAEEARPVAKRLYDRLGAFMQLATITLPAGRVVGNWPTESQAEQHAAKMRKHYHQRFTVRKSDRLYKPRIHTQ